MRYVFNVIASVGRQNDVYRPIKIQKSYRPTVFFKCNRSISGLIASVGGDIADFSAFDYT